MKPLFSTSFFLIAMLLISTVSCKKEMSGNQDAFDLIIKPILKDSMQADIYASLDFSRIVQTKMGETNLTRIGLKGTSLASDFVLVQTNAMNHFIQGRIIHLERSGGDNEVWNGKITIQRLDGEQVISSGIGNGYITAFHDGPLERGADEPSQHDPYVELPEVIIVSSYGSGSASLTSWYSLLCFLDDFNSTGGGSGGYYSSSDPYSGSWGSGSIGGSGTISSPVVEEPIKIDYENQYNREAIDVAKYMKCFAAIPDAGATGSIEIFADIPVNGDPTKFFDWQNGSPGHVFIKLTKQNSTSSVSQFIGFYPASGWKTTLSSAPIAGKFVNNSQHEFNASLKVNLNTSQVQTAITRFLYLARFVKYDIDEYNCTDWALDVFNTAVKVEQQLINVPRYHIPGGSSPYGTNTPQGIYMRLQEMKNAGGTGAAGITIPLAGWAGTGKGACN